MSTLALKAVVARDGHVASARNTTESTTEKVEFRWIGITLTIVAIVGATTYFLCRIFRRRSTNPIMGDPDSISYLSAIQERSDLRNTGNPPSTWKRTPHFALPSQPTVTGTAPSIAEGFQPYCTIEEVAQEWRSRMGAVPFACEPADTTLPQEPSTPPPDQTDVYGRQVNVSPLRHQIRHRHGSRP